MSEVFSAENYVANVIWVKNFSPKNTAKYFSVDHDYLIVFANNKTIWLPHLLPRSTEADDRYSNQDNDPRGDWTSSDLTARNYYSEGTYKVSSPNGKIFQPTMGTYWRVSKETFNELDRDNRIWWGKDGANMPRQKRFLNEVKQGIVPQTLWGHDEVGHTQDAKRELLSIVDFKSAEDVLNIVKPVSLIRRVLQISEREI
jgi:adenine-specific DNA-methyltransferase